MCYILALQYYRVWFITVSNFVRWALYLICWSYQSPVWWVWLNVCATADRQQLLPRICASFLESYLSFFDYL